MPGYKWYWGTDRFSMYNAFALAPGPSRQLLAIHTPLGLLEPTRMIFGEMNAGTVACSLIPAQLRTLPTTLTSALLLTWTITPKVPTPSRTSYLAGPTI